MINKIKGVLFGLAVGDALGVPVEFKSREYLKLFPIKGLTGNGTWNQPAGTWSDDSSLAFCLTESLTKGYNLDDIANNFCKWLQKGYWGAHHKVFDVGGATSQAIGRLIRGESPLVSGGIMDEDNGNGSLMRILPLLFSVNGLPIDDRYKRVREVSSITHAHFRSVFSCFIYIEFALHILNGKTAIESYRYMQDAVNVLVREYDFNKEELQLFDRILKGNIKDVKESGIHSGGYVIYTLEASIWCLLNTDNYADAVLKAVNLGEDTDTTACVTGGLAGLLYGYEEIYKAWIKEIARKDDIEDLCIRINEQISK